MKPHLTCAIYTRKSSEEGLEQEFNSLHAQREACAAYVASQKGLGWKLIDKEYDDGGYTGGNLQRPALEELLADIRAGRIQVIVVYKVDRLTRSLADFAKLIEVLDAHDVSFVSITQQFNTTTSMGRLTLNVLLSFAQFEREVTGERIRDKIDASKKKGMWMGGNTPMGYVSRDQKLYIDEIQGERIRELFRLYLELGSVRALKLEVDRRGWVTPTRTSRRNHPCGGRPLSAGHLRNILKNPVYRGQIAHKAKIHPGQHPAIIEQELWDAVQKHLNHTLHLHQIRYRTENPCLLAGMVFDDKGRRFGTTSTFKKLRRYRYYVSEQQDTDTPAWKADRIPAKQLDGIVIEAIVGFLRDRNRMAEFLGSEDEETIAQQMTIAEEKVNSLCRGSNSDQIALLRNLLGRVTLYHEYIELKILWTDVSTPESSQSATPLETTLSVPAELTRSGISLRMTIPPAGKVKTSPQATSISALIVKAHDWMSRLTSGRYEGVHAIAAEEKVSGSYVTRIIYLACLAPDIAMLILKGKHPAHLTARKLLSAVPLPERWEDQRRLLGVTP